MLLCDVDIRRLCTGSGINAPASPPVVFPVDWRPMIEPFSEGVSGGGVISYGLTSAGYDLRLGPEILIFKNSYGLAIDPKRFNDPDYHEYLFDNFNFGHITQHSNYDVRKGTIPFTIPPQGYILGRSYEYLRIPKTLKGRCVGKSTYARSGILVNTTPLEPGWEGHLTIEIGNITSCPATVYVLEGIAQLEFEVLSGVPEIDYAAKQGKYQSQTGVTPARVL